MKHIPYIFYSMWLLFAINDLVEGDTPGAILAFVLFIGSTVGYFISKQRLNSYVSFLVGLVWPISFLLLFLYGMYKYSLWQQKNVTQPMMVFLKAFDIGLGSSPNGLNYCCVNCGTRMGRGIFGNWAPAALKSPCLDSGKQCVPTRMP